MRGLWNATAQHTQELAEGRLILLSSLAARDRRRIRLYVLARPRPPGPRADCGGEGKQSWTPGWLHIRLGNRDLDHRLVPFPPVGLGFLDMMLDASVAATAGP